MVPDAFWCWPGNMTLLLATARAGITASGGWSNGVWRPDFQQRDHVGPRLAASMIYAGGVGVALRTELDPEGGEYLQEITEAELEQRTQGCAVSARIFDDPISAGPRSPWRFDIDLPANWRLPARLKGLESLHRDTLQGGYVPRMVSDDFDRLLTAAGGRDEFDFHYCSPDLVWHIVLSEWPVIDWPGGRGFHFSHKHCASTSTWIRHHFARPALSLAEAARLFRDVADAFLGWRGTLETPTIWDSYGDEAYSHKPRKYLQPVETMSGIYSQIAGIRCARRAKTFSYAVAR